MGQCNELEENDCKSDMIGGGDKEDFVVLSCLASYSIALKGIPSSGPDLNLEQTFTHARDRSGVDTSGNSRDNSGNGGNE